MNKSEVEFNIGELKFIWNKQKAEINLLKHDGIEFKDAAYAFVDPKAYSEPDEKHSYEEDRQIVVGLSRKSRIVLVVHVYYECENTIRIISARKATSKEKRKYEKGSSR